MAVEVAAEEVAKCLCYKDRLRDLQRQVVVGLVGCRDGSCLQKFLSGLCTTGQIFPTANAHEEIRTSHLSANYCGLVRCELARLAIYNNSKSTSVTRFSRCKFPTLKKNFPKFPLIGVGV